MFAMWRLHYAPLVIIQCVVIWSAEQRSQLSKSRVPSVCRPKSSRSPQGKRPVARDPRPGTAMRWGSTSGSSTCTVLLRPWSRSYPPVKYGYSLVLRTTILGQANYICCSPGWKSNVILEWSLVLQRELFTRPAILFILGFEAESSTGSFLSFSFAWSSEFKLAIYLPPSFGLSTVLAGRTKWRLGPVMVVMVTVHLFNRFIRAEACVKVKVLVSTNHAWNTWNAMSYT